MRQLLERYEAELIAAVETDMDKAPYETFMTEMLPIYREIDYYLKHLNKWHRETKKTKRSLFGRYKGALIREPYGVVYIISSWSNPLLDCLLPLVDTLGAGNCVIIKTSQLNVHVTELLQRILGEAFSPKLISVSANDHDYVESMIAARPDFIFFYRSTVYWAAYYAPGQPFYDSLGFTDGGKILVLSVNRLIFKTRTEDYLGEVVERGQTVGRRIMSLPTTTLRRT